MQRQNGWQWDKFEYFLSISQIRVLVEAWFHLHSLLRLESQYSERATGLQSEKSRFETQQGQEICLS